MKYLLDTNILIQYVNAKPLMQHIENTFSPFTVPQENALSVVSLAEIRTIAKMNNWGKTKIDRLNYLVGFLVVVDIEQSLVESYVNIDAFSQGRSPLHISNFSAKNMGKNDLWIAATASALGITLLTTDRDFEHLDPYFLKVIQIIN
jgi:tRNA(fMet)-specific endonuclease VapC